MDAVGDGDRVSVRRWQHARCVPGVPWCGLKHHWSTESARGDEKSSNAIGFVAARASSVRPSVGFGRVSLDPAPASLPAPPDDRNPDVGRLPFSGVPLRLRLFAAHSGHRKGSSATGVAARTPPEPRCDAHAPFPTADLRDPRLDATDAIGAIAGRRGRAGREDGGPAPASAPSSSPSSSPRPRPRRSPSRPSRASTRRAASSRT